MIQYHLLLLSGLYVLATYIVPYLHRHAKLGHYVLLMVFIVFVNYSFICFTLTALAELLDNSLDEVFTFIYLKLCIMHLDNLLL